MPHQCTDCDELYADGSDIIQGCPDCSGRTFQYVPPNRIKTLVQQKTEPDVDSSTDDAEVLYDDAHIIGESEDGESTPEESEVIIAEDSPEDRYEDASQHAARTDVVELEDLPDLEDLIGDGSDDPQDLAVVVDETTPEDEEDFNLESIQKELNREFEGIRVLAPGQYEINPARLFEREECIIALQEDGRYMIQTPTRFDADKDDEDDE